MRKFNFDEFIWFIIQISLLAMFVYLIKSNIINSFINEKMMIYLYISLVILTVYIFGQLFKIISIPSRVYITNKFFPMVSVIVLTVTFFYLIPSYDMVANNEMENKYNLSEGTITIDDTNFKMLYDDEINNLVGETINFTGKIKEVNSEYVILYREVVSCCQNDKIKLEVMVKGSNFTEDNIGSFVMAVGEVKFLDRAYIDATIYDIVEQPVNLFFHE